MQSKLHTGLLGLTVIVLALTGCTAPADDRAAGDAPAGEACTPQTTCAGMTYQQAIEIARRDGCLEAAQLRRCYTCNEDTGTWWLDLTLDEPRPGCAPACVVDVKTGTAEINWRCTGALPPQPAD